MSAADLAAAQASSASMNPASQECISYNQLFLLDYHGAMENEVCMCISHVPHAILCQHGNSWYFDCCVFFSVSGFLVAYLSHVLDDVVVWCYSAGTLCKDPARG